MRMGDPNENNDLEFRAFKCFCLVFSTKVNYKFFFLKIEELQIFSPLIVLDYVKNKFKRINLTEMIN